MRRITSLVTKFDHRLAQRIQAAVQADEPLDQLNSEPEHIFRYIFCLGMPHRELRAC